METIPAKDFLDNFVQNARNIGAEREEGYVSVQQFLDELLERIEALEEKKEDPE